MAEVLARVLVVDDERFFREAISEILEERGFECELCESGESALARVEKASFAVVVLDIRMPGMDGIDVLRALRDTHPDLRVIILSASTDQERVLEALRLGACDYLAKPLHDEELCLAVHRAAESYAVVNDWGQLQERLDRMAGRMEKLVLQMASLAGEDRERLLEQAAAEVAAEVLEAGKTSLMLLNEEGDALRVAATVGNAVDPEMMEPVPIGQGIAGQAFASSEPLLVQNLEADDRFTAGPDPDRYQSDSFAIVPLSVANRPFGVLCAADRLQGGEFGPADLSLLRLLSLQIAELMRVGRRSPETSTPLVLRRDEDTAETIPLDLARDLADAVGVCEGAADRDAEMARRICDAVVNEVTPDAVLRAALRPIEQALDADPVAIYLIDDESTALVLESESEGATRADRPHLQMGKGLTGTVLQTGHLVATADPAADPRFDADIDTAADAQVRPFLCVPLQLRGKTVGICRIFLPAGASVSARTGEVLVAVLSAAIRNVLLYRSLVESIEDVATARREARR